MKNLLLTSLSLLSISGLTQSLEWAKTFGGEGNDEPFSIAVDANGYSYTTGCYEGTVDFDPNEGVMNLTSESSSADMYVQKLDENGELVWAFGLGDNLFDIGYEIVLDDAGDLIIGGKFAGTVDFDPGPGTEIKTSTGNSDAFVMKIDSDMNLIWVITTEGLPGDDTFFAGLGVDGGNNIYLQGFMEGMLDVDPGPGTFMVGNPGMFTFKLKLDADGNFVWATELPYIVYKSIEVDEDGNVYSTGQFSGTIDFDPSAGTLNKTSIMFEDIFVSKVDTDGNVQWVQQIPSLGFGEGIAAASSGDIYVTGNFSGSSIDFDPGVGSTLLSSNGGQDVFVLKMDDAGNLIWAESFGANIVDNGTGITTDAADNVFIAGTFMDSVDFDPGPGTDTLISQPGHYNAFVLALLSDGSYDWAISTDGPQTAGREVEVDGLGSVYYTGYFQDSSDFNPDTSIVELHYAPGNDNSIHTSKISSCAKVVWVEEEACTQFEYDGNIYTTTGLYELTYTTGPDCDSLVKIDVTIAPAIDVSISQFDDLFIVGASGAIYQWVDCDDAYSPLLGETNQTFIPSSNGNYACIVTQYGCNDTSDCFVVDDLGLNDNLNAELHIYPNPAKDMINLILPTSEGTIMIYDATGKLVSQMNVTSSQLIIQSTNWENGVYHLIYYTNDAVSRKQLIICH